MKKTMRKVFVLGLDGATGDLLYPWAKEGLLPNFRTILDRGTWGKLTSTLPPLTVPAWMSFMTGKKPEKHGLFDFVYRLPDSYEVYPVNNTLCSEASIWSLLSEADKKVGVLNVPATYPPEKTNGFMITGMLTPEDADDFTFPPSLIEELKSHIPEYAIWPARAYHFPGGEEVLLDFIRRMTQIRIEAANYLNERFNWDFFMTVFRSTDVVQHWFWRFMDREHFRYDPDASEKLKNGILSIYQEIDSYLGKLLDSFTQETLLIVMSDHGFGPLEKYVYINNFLLDKGYLKLKTNPKAKAKFYLYRAGFTPFNLYRILLWLKLGKNIAAASKHHRKGFRAFVKNLFLSFEDVDWKNTKAYSMGNTGAIFINKKGREPDGTVAEGREADQVAKDIIRDFFDWINPQTGEKMVGRVYGPGEVPWKTSSINFPDIYFEMKNERHFPFARYNFPSNSWMEPAFDMSAWHRKEGVIMLFGHGVKSGFALEKAHIVDLAPTILAYLGIPIPRDMDGRVLKEPFENQVFKDAPITFTDRSSHRKIESKEFSEEEAQKIKEKLKNLGYFS
jgi:predicted AlkP superfamily phosphohydrolase/phosphomutase